MTIGFHPPEAREALGYLPEFLSWSDHRPAREQINANYQHGGGWCPVKGWTMEPGTGVIQYPGDEPIKAIALGVLRDEVIRFYPGSWVSILQRDGTFEVARVD